MRPKIPGCNYIPLHFAVCEPACFSGPSDPQSSEQWIFNQEGKQKVLLCLKCTLSVTGITQVGPLATSPLWPPAVGLVLTHCRFKNILIVHVFTVLALSFNHKIVGQLFPRLSRSTLGSKVKFHGMSEAAVKKWTLSFTEVPVLRMSFVFMLPPCCWRPVTAERMTSSCERSCWLALTQSGSLWQSVMDDPKNARLWYLSALWTFTFPSQTVLLVSGCQIPQAWSTNRCCRATGRPTKHHFTLSEGIGTHSWITLVYRLFLSFACLCYIHRWQDTKEFPEHIRNL